MAPNGSKSVKPFQKNAKGGKKVPKSRKKRAKSGKEKKKKKKKIQVGLKMGPNGSKWLQINDFKLLKMTPNS